MVPALGSVCGKPALGNRRAGLSDAPMAPVIAVEQGPGGSRRAARQEADGAIGGD